MKLVNPQRGRVLKYPLQSRIITVGRTEDNDITVEDSHASSYHAVIRQQHRDGIFIIYDAGSLHGTWVNEERVTESRQLKTGDKVRIGRTVFMVLEDDQELPPLEPVGEDTSPALRRRARPAPTAPGVAASNGRSRTPELVRQTAPVRDILDFLRSGLSQLEARTISSETSDNSLSALLRRADVIGKGLFSTVIAGPAFLLVGWQKLLELVGVGPEDAFPQGTWQFYAEFGLREDPARHANESTGFHNAVPLEAREVDLITAWLYQIILTYFEYDAFLENEWSERVLLRLVDEALDDAIAEELAGLRTPQGERLPPEQREQMKRQMRLEQPESVEIGREERKRELGLQELNTGWIKRRPYKRDITVPKETYPQYRRRKFLTYLSDMAEKLPPDMGASIWEEYHNRSETELPAYQEQMTILKALTPGRYKEEREDIPLWKAKVGLILGGRYYLIDAAARDKQGDLLVFEPGKTDGPGMPLALGARRGDELRDENGNRVSIDRKGNVTIHAKRPQVKVLRPIAPRELKAQVAACLRQAQEAQRSTRPFDTDLLLAATPRGEQRRVRSLLPRTSQREIQLLRLTPVILHWDLRRGDQPIGYIRRGRRGIGDHALTIFRSGRSFVFDLSHIFYDAIWAAALSQILTDGAIEQYQAVASLSLPPISTINPVYPLALESGERFRQETEAYQWHYEVVAESAGADLGKINALRRTLREQENIYITVNDILTLYRSLHDVFYTPGDTLQSELKKFRAESASDPQKMDFLKQLEAMHVEMHTANPSLLIPMDASFISPKLRLMPTTFRNPWPNLVDIYRDTRQALREAQKQGTSQSRATFVYQRRALLDHLLALAEYLAALKRITRQGESFNVATIKLLAHLPPTMQGTLDLIPQRIGVLNEIIKGQEVFSNVGQVAPASSLERFMSAKDDGETKQMVWGIMSTSDGKMKLTLRDFRHPIVTLVKLDYRELAQLFTQDYLNSYAHGLNSFADDLRDIVKTTYD
jgi:pSer/pThr/pTyr-binding forkhead associated (FHA) protein